MTAPSPNGSEPTQPIQTAEETESAIAAGMAAGDTEAVMRAVATTRSSSLRPAGRTPVRPMARSRCR